MNKFFKNGLFASNSILFTITLAAATKLLQLCLTLCDPMDGSPPGSRPWDSPGKNTGVGCHLFLQCMKVKSENEVAQSCPTLSDFPGKSTGVGWDSFITSVPFLIWGRQVSGRWCGFPRITFNKTWDWGLNPGLFPLSRAKADHFGVIQSTIRRGPGSWACTLEHLLKAYYRTSPNSC